MDRSGNKATIVYADDDMDDLELMEEIIHSIDPGITLHRFTNGKQAFEYLESIPEGSLLPSLIILDLNMPVWDGWKTLDAIKGHDLYQEIPIYIFTNSDHPAHRELSLKRGAIDFVTKPYSKAELEKIGNVFVGYVSQAARAK